MFNREDMTQLGHQRLKNEKNLGKFQVQDTAVENIQFLDNFHWKVTPRALSLGS